MIIIKHLPALQVLIPFCGGLFSILTLRYVWLARTMSICASVAGLTLGLYCEKIVLLAPISYVFGNWRSDIGIEYVLDKFNQPIIICSNFLLCFFILFSHELIREKILKYIEEKRQSLFYAILLFAHAGFVGMLSTNDLFNLYVFIEISSLATYVLVSQGADPRSYVSAFEYLIVGTIGATLILLSIGFLFAITGSLNMSDIHNDLSIVSAGQIRYFALCFFCLGAMLKIAFFPMHFWMIKAYDSAPSTILIYIAPISSIVGSYIILRFLYFVIDYDYFIAQLQVFLRPMSLIAIVVCSFLALSSKRFKHIVLYASCVQIGYIILMLLTKSTSLLIIKILLIDSLNKAGLFFIVAYSEILTVKQTSENIWRFLVCLMLICNAGLPLTPMFIIKLDIFETLLSQNMLLDLVTIIIASALSVVFYYRIAFVVLSNNFESDASIQYSSRARYVGLVVSAIAQIISLFHL